LFLTGLQDSQDFLNKKPLWPLCLCVRKKTEEFVMHADDTDYSGFSQICFSNSYLRQSKKICVICVLKKNGGLFLMKNLCVRKKRRNE